VKNIAVNRLSRQGFLSYNHG